MSDRELWEVAKATAKTVSIVDFENAHGVDFVRFSGSEYMHPLYDSLKVNGYLWKRHSGLTGKLCRFTSGTAITYVMEYYGLSFRDAVHELLDFANPELLAQVKGSSGSAVREEAVRQYSSVADILRRAKADRETEEKKKLIKPMPDKDNAELIEYLCKTRGINRDLVDLCIKRGLLYQTLERTVCFIGNDENNIPAYAFCRGIYDDSKREQPGSSKKYCFRLTLDPDSVTVFVFEAAIDLLSFISLNILHGTNSGLDKGRYLSLGGIDDGALRKYLSMNPNITDIVLCLDNDKVGQDAGKKLHDKFSAECNVSVRRVSMADTKDWNEALVAFLAMNGV